MLLVGEEEEEVVVVLVVLVVVVLVVVEVVVVVVVVADVPCIFFPEPKLTKVSRRGAKTLLSIVFSYHALYLSPMHHSSDTAALCACWHGKRVPPPPLHTTRPMPTVFC
jgi:hypothetical protein